VDATTADLEADGDIKINPSDNIIKLLQFEEPASSLSSIAMTVSMASNSANCVWINSLNLAASAPSPGKSCP
jgi:hypothetical protein